MLRNPYTRDQMRIFLEADSLRRSRHTTQVYVGNEDVRLTDRLIHALMVMAIASPIARHCGLNDELTGAISIGHDLGHCPFGHYGEKWISGKAGIELDHRIIGCIILQHVENGGEGFNLSHEVLSGIYHHSGHRDRSEYLAYPDEFQLVNIADKIAYLFEDPEDANRLGIDQREVTDRLSSFGATKNERVNNTICALLEESMEAKHVSFVGDFGQKFWDFQTFMYKRFYHALDHRRNYLGACLQLCWDYLVSEPYFEGINPALLMALMNDEEIFRLVAPLRNRDLATEDLLALRLSITDLVEVLRAKPLDLENPDLDWDPI
jgi:dGTPase